MKSNQDWLELAYTVNLLSRLTESASKYQNDCSWGEDLEEDIQEANRLIRKYYKQVKEAA